MLISALLIDPSSRTIEPCRLAVDGGDVDLAYLADLLQTQAPPIWRDAGSVRVAYASDAAGEHAATIVDSSFREGAESYRARTIIGRAVVYGVRGDVVADCPVDAAWMAERVVWSRID